MRYLILFFTFIMISFQAVAQLGEEAYSFLRFPASTRVNALGGANVSLVERDPSLALHNPALLGGEMDKMISLSYMNYISDINVGNLLFSRILGERGTWGVGVTYINYGTFDLKDNNNNGTGTFSANDIALRGLYSYDLSDKWRGGLSLLFLYSAFEKYSSFGLGVDAGLSYYDADKDFSFGIALKSIGAQLKAYETDRQKMPWDIQAGISKRVAHAPFRFSLTARYLNQWKFDAVDDLEPEAEDNFLKTLVKHFVIGVDFIPSDNFWVGIGYNPKTHYDMQLSGGNTFSGFTAGAGVKIKSFDVGVSLAHFHPSATSLMLTVSASLEKFAP